MTADVLRFAAFPDDGRGGNPAGVVLDATGMTAHDMQAVAAEVGYSETAFLLPGPGDALRVRYFTPTAEIDFCGHATIAAGVALADRHGPGDLALATNAGSIRVRTALAAGTPTATLTSPPARSEPVVETALAPVLAALGWTPEDLDPRFPPRRAFAGNHHLVVAARDRDRLARLDADEPALHAAMTALGVTTVHAFCAESPTVHHVRNLCPVVGIPEDPATGSAAAAFGGYLRDLGVVSAPARVTVLQGFDMGRPCRLLVDLVPGTDTVDVTGTAVPIPDSGGS